KKSREAESREQDEREATFQSPAGGSKQEGGLATGARRRGQLQTSSRATSAFCSMNNRRGSTSSPISLVKISSAAIPSSICTLSRRRDCGSIVVSQSCSGFISPRPL